MALLHVQFYSVALQVNTAIEVILPEPQQGIGISTAQESSLPGVLYLLHGYSDDQSVWMRRTSVERYAARHNLAVVMPAVNHSFYCNEPNGERYWDFVSDELPQVVHSFFRLSHDPARTFVAGLSMGGYGALRLGLTFPERFAAVGSFSGVLDLAGMAMAGSRPDLRISRLFPDPKAIAGSDNDLYALLDRQAAHRPRLFIACGTADHLYPMHVPFIEQAQAKAWSVDHMEQPAIGHQWAFWDAMIEHFIETYCGGCV